MRLSLASRAVLASIQAYLRKTGERLACSHLAALAECSPVEAETYLIELAIAGEVTVADGLIDARCRELANIRRETAGKRWRPKVLVRNQGKIPSSEGKILRFALQDGFAMQTPNILPSPGGENRGETERKPSLVACSDTPKRGPLTGVVFSSSSSLISNNYFLEERRTTSKQERRIGMESREQLPDMTEDFAEFWQVWPVPTHRHTAERAYVGLRLGRIKGVPVEGYPHDAIMQQARLAVEYATLRQISLPNAGRWLEDECGRADYPRAIQAEIERQAARQGGGRRPVDSGMIA